MWESRCSHPFRKSRTTAAVLLECVFDLLANLGVQTRCSPHHVVGGGYSRVAPLQPNGVAVANQRAYCDASYERKRFACGGVAKQPQKERTSCSAVVGATDGEGVRPRLCRRNTAESVQDVPPREGRSRVGCLERTVHGSPWRAPRARLRT